MNRNCLKLERVRNGWLQWKLADALGICNSRLSLIESGRVKASPQDKKACSKILKVSENVLFPNQI